MNPFGVKFTARDVNELFAMAGGLKKLTHHEKLVIIEGLAPLDKEIFVAFARALSPQSPDPFVHWDFGFVMELKVDEDSPNYLFSNEKVPFHWDGAFHETPSALLFNCIEAPQSSGRTLYANTEAVYQSLDNEEKSLLEGVSIEYETEKQAHYGGVFVQKVLDIHPITGARTLRMGEEVITKKNPVKRKILNSTPEIETLIHKIEERLYEADFVPNTFGKTETLC